VVLPLQPFELRNRIKQAGCGRVQSRNICFGHVPVAVRQGERRDAVATGEEPHGRCAAGKITYIGLYRHSGKLALAPMNLRRDRVVGHSFAAGAQPLAHVCTVCASGTKNRRGPPAALPGTGVWRHAWGDGAHCPNGRHGAKYRSIHQHEGLEPFSKIPNESLRKELLATTSHQAPNPTTLRSAQQRFLLDPPVVQRLLK
jgi:hypothetical protein